MENIGYRTYHENNLETQISGATPTQLALVLTDGLLDELIRARAHIVSLRYAAKGESIAKCVAIINGLNSALDVESDSAAVLNLAELYEYCAWRLIQASNDLDVMLIDEVSGLMATVRDGWQAVVETK